MNYYPRYPGHYVAKTLHLTMEQDGAYTRLLDWVYLNERPVPHGARYAITRAMSPSEKRAVDAVLAEFFARDGEEWRNDRAAEEIQDAQPKIAAARANGRKGGRPKKKPSDKPSRNPMGFSNETQDEPSAKAPQSPIPTTPPDTSTTHPALSRRSLDDCGSFEGHQPPPPNPAAPHAIALNRAGVRVTTLNPDLVAYAAEGGTPDHLTELVALPEFHGKPAAYVIRAARRMLAEGAKPIAGETHAAPRKLSAAEEVRAAVARRQSTGPLAIVNGERRVG